MDTCPFTLSLPPPISLCPSTLLLISPWCVFVCLCVNVCYVKALTVREMFGRHLMQLPGLSADKAAVILGEYPTLEK